MSPANQCLGNKTAIAYLLMENSPNYHPMFCGGRDALSPGGQVRTGWKST